jgi:hypothetical protein
MRMQILELSTGKKPFNNRAEDIKILLLLANMQLSGSHSSFFRGGSSTNNRLLSDPILIIISFSSRITKGLINIFSLQGSLFGEGMPEILELEMRGEFRIRKMCIVII